VIPSRRSDRPGMFLAFAGLRGESRVFPSCGDVHVAIGGCGGGSCRDF
jgi:hypothetical protein